MPLNRAYLGRTLGPLKRHQVTAEELRAFADAVGDHNPVHRDPAAAARYGHPAVVAVPTYVVALALRAERPLFDDPGFGADPARLRHVEAGTTAHRPVYASDVLGCAVRVDAIERIGPHELLTTVTSVTDASGRPVAEVRSVVVVLGG
ncbi:MULTISPECIES: MaoC family dehydratase N-terminal domain-containing protein [unclassified Streptomyces]|uniref:FAS1-like dehydratase domain-containing protein n=1 Tax=unclassified Streptomyces TaxID=2593676 RepID=UPI00382FBEC1